MRGVPTPSVGKLIARLVAMGLLVLVGGCRPRPRMCAANDECSGQSACVAGRCQVQGPNLAPAIAKAQRLVFRPRDAAFVSSTEAVPWARACEAQTFGLGRASERLLLRFDVDLPPQARVVEAFVVLHRSSLVDESPPVLSLRVDRIASAWESATLRWPFVPRLEDVGSPVTRVREEGPALVRLDVSEIVRAWARRSPRDVGLAVRADEGGDVSARFAWCHELSSDDAPDERGGSIAPSQPPAAENVGPYLEIYVRDTREPDAGKSATMGLSKE